MVNLLQTRSSAVAQRLCDASCLSVVSFNSIKRQAQSSIISYTLALDLPLRKLNYVLFSSAYSLVRGFLCHKGRISLFQPAKKPGRKLVASRSKAGRKSAVNLLKTDFFFFFVQNAHEAANLLRFATRFSTKSRKLVESVSQTRTNENLAANLVENQVCSRLE